MGLDVKQIKSDLKQIKSKDTQLKPDHASIAEKNRLIIAKIKFNRSVNQIRKAAAEQNPTTA
mgnify:CR=1 FL=1|jgi:hypothetical protein